MDDGPVHRLREAVARLAAEVGTRPPTNRSHDDADDTVGTVGTDDAVGFDPFPLLRALDLHGAEAVVIGQVAGILHGSRELTGDLDLLWSGDSGQTAAFAAAFGSLSADLTDADGHPVACGPAAFAGPKVQFRTAAAAGDCCTPALPWGDLPIVDFLRRCRTARTDGFDIRYLDRADLISMRRAAGRPKDLRRARELDRDRDWNRVDLAVVAPAKPLHNRTSSGTTTARSTSARPPGGIGVTDGYVSGVEGSAGGSAGAGS